MASIRISDRTCAGPLFTLSAGQMDSLNEQLAKAAALAEIATSCDLLDYRAGTIHNYLWVLHDLIVQAQVICQQI